jgi:hypothetical protein
VTRRKLCRLLRRRTSVLNLGSEFLWRESPLKEKMASGT